MKQIAITGGKGGTGKSTVATALAVALGKKHKVLLVDADVDCPNDHLLLGIKRKKVKTVRQRIPKLNEDKCAKCGLCSTVCKVNAVFGPKGKMPIFMQQQCNGCGACVLSCPAKAISWAKKEIGYVYKGKGHGIDFISGELKVNEAVSEFVVSALKEISKEIGKKYDFVVVDTAAGTHCDVIEALKGADVALAVTEPTPLGQHDLELIMNLLKRLGINFEIILNRFEEGNTALIEDSAAMHGKKIWGKIPYKKEIMEAYSKGVPVEDNSIGKIMELVE
ncbi:MAG: ATP-binding protein [Candidatus Diapherotrites archaeon]|nr:ATP-binding protein [Candidatus Diapherotrites archaeon]